jgi:ATP-dependent DNA helicase RecG
VLPSSLASEILEENQRSIEQQLTGMRFLTAEPLPRPTFNDRIEIQNPGGPFGQVNRQNFGQPGITNYRNPHLAEAMKNLGYVQRFGIGIQLARQQLQKNGNPPLEFLVEDGYVLVMLRIRL